MTFPNRMDLGHGGRDNSPTVVGPVTTATTAELGDYVLVDTSGGAVTVTLPSADMAGLVHVRLYAGTTAVTVARTGTDTIDGATSIQITITGEIVTLTSDGAGTWRKLSGSFTLAALNGQFVQATEDVLTVAASGAAFTVPDPADYGWVDITLTAATVALTFPAASAGKTLKMVFRQDGTGNRAVTWPVNSIFPGGTDVVITVAASSVDYVEAFCVAEDVWMITRIGAAYAV